MNPVVDHIQITVRNMRVAIPFYDKLSLFLGFDPKRRPALLSRNVSFMLSSTRIRCCHLLLPLHGGRLRTKRLTAGNQGRFITSRSKLNRALKSNGCMGI